MSKKEKQPKETLMKWGKDFVKQSDHGRLTQAKSNYDKLPLELQNKFFMSLADTVNFYPDKKAWSKQENDRVRLVWNWMPTDEICDHFVCSHRSLINQAIVLGLHDINDKTALNSEDLDLMKKLQDSEMTIKGVAEVFGMQYDFKETKTFDKDERGVIEMTAQDLFGGNL